MQGRIPYDISLFGEAQTLSSDNGGTQVHQQREKERALQNRVQSICSPARSSRPIQLDRAGAPASGGKSPFGEPHPWGDRQDFVTDTIFEGVTGKIFGAFQQVHPNMTKALFTHFADEVRRGLHCGIGEARGNLKSDDSLSIAMDDAINDDENVLLARLENWFNRTHKELLC